MLFAQVIILFAAFQPYERALRQDYQHNTSWSWGKPLIRETAKTDFLPPKTETQEGAMTQ